MKKQAYTSISTKKTPQSEKILGSNQVENSAGGFVYQIDDWKRLERFLIIGSEEGTYYVNERKLTVDNAEVAIRCISEDGERVLKMVSDISISGRAPSNDPALFVLVLLTKFGSGTAVNSAYNALPQIARTATHLFHFVQYREQFAGWGNGMKRAVSRWYTEKSADDLAYQLIKYRQRDGWSHRDLLRLAHPKTNDAITKATFDWVVNQTMSTDLPKSIHGYEQVSVAEKVEDTIQLIQEYNLPWEAVKTEHLGDKEVWSTILNSGKYGMPLTALLRNLGRFSKLGVIDPQTEDYTFILDKLTNEEAIKKARIHPLAVLIALVTYGSGGGHLSKMQWKADSGVRHALNEMFYKAFGNVVPMNKNVLIALDVSSSMRASFGGTIVSCAQGGAAMLMTVARAEKVGSYRMGMFTHGIKSYRDYELTPFSVGPKDNLDTVMKYTYAHNFGGTDCSLPMAAALNKEWDIDAFIVITDNETWAGDIHPSQALNEYREKMGKPNAKLVVVGMTSTDFSIADPDDLNMLDVVGFDTATPNLISDFVRG